MWDYLSPEQRRIVREARYKKGLKQFQLAELIAVSRSHLCRIENGLAQCSPELRQELEQWLGLEVNSLSPANTTHRLCDVEAMLEILNSRIMLPTKERSDFDHSAEDREKQERRGCVFGSPVQLNELYSIGLEVDKILSALPPETRPLAAHLVLNVTKIITSVLQLHGSEG